MVGRPLEQHPALAGGGRQLRAGTWAAECATRWAANSGSDARPDQPGSEDRLPRPSGPLQSGAPGRVGASDTAPPRRRPVDARGHRGAVAAAATTGGVAGRPPLIEAIPGFAEPLETRFCYIKSRLRYTGGWMRPALPRRATANRARARQGGGPAPSGPVRVARRSTKRFVVPRHDRTRQPAPR